MSTPIARNKEEKEMNRHTIVAGIAVLVSAIMSPLWVSYYIEYGESRLYLECLFCQIDCIAFSGYYVRGFVFWGLVGQFILWSFRLVFVYQLIRFYEGKTTTGLLSLAGMIGETPAILFVTYTMMMGFVGHIIPLPLHLLVAWVFLKARPPPELSTPWTEASEASGS